MGIAEEYALRVKTPLTKVTVVKFFDGERPGVDNEGYYYYPEVISCDITYGFDQGSTSCTLELKTPLDESGNYVRFEPMNRVEVEQGWNKSSTLRATFFGFIDKVDYSNPPKQVRLECRDILKLAQDNYYIHSTRKVYSAVPAETELDDSGTPMGGQAVEDRQAQEIITDFMVDSGVPEDRLHLDFETYPASGAIVIGNNAVAVFVYESAMDAITRITDLIGYRIWADKGGHIQSREVRPIGGETSSQKYQSQEETYDSDAGTWTITQSGNLMSISTSKNDDLRNWVTVYGYDGISTTIVGESDYVPSPPTYRRTEIRSYLLDTPELLVVVASGIYTDLNRLGYTARATIEGDPRLEIGQTIRLYDSYAMTDTIDYFLYDFSSSFRAGLWTMDLNLVGGVGAGTEGSPPIKNISPIAMFTSKVEQSYLADGSYIYDVIVDASPSYDPNGPLDELQYGWVCPGHDSASGITNSYATSGLGTLYVTLTVTDQGVPPLSSEITLPIVLSGAKSVWRTIFVASTDRIVYTTDDGGVTWIQKELY